MRRWVCPSCSAGLLAPDRPRLDDVRRYCLPCSQRSGRLVQRACPALERERAQRAERSKERAAAKRSKERQRAEAARSHSGVNIDREAAKLWRLMAPYHRGRALPEIEIRRRPAGYSTGRASSRRVVMTLGAGEPPCGVLMLLAHELAHSACPGSGHQERWADCYSQAARERWGREHFTGIRPARGYAVDPYIEQGIARALAAQEAAS